VLATITPRQRRRQAGGIGVLVPIGAWGKRHKEAGVPRRPGSLRLPAPERLMGQIVCWRQAGQLIAEGTLHMPLAWIAPTSGSLER